MSRSTNFSGIITLVLIFISPIPCNAEIMVAVESFEGEYYQTTTWEESEIYWYAEASIGSEVLLEDFDWTVGLTSARSYTESDFNKSDGNHSVEIYMSGLHDDGVVWLEKKFQVREAIKSVYLSGHLFSETESAVNNWQVLMFIGVKNPGTESDLRGLNDEGIVGYTNEVAGWKKYNQTAKLAVPAGAVVYLAFGLSVTSEYDRTYYIDAIEFYYIPQTRYTPGFLFWGSLTSFLTIVIIASLKKKKLSP